ncbi:MAG: hypothetical protein Ct9H300mP13_7240 [Gammaproteobacteria bacterium]|nr:MAG: hypothetical protein Ct9H300mP13_7240 [Gammaproteobacteria bacterium]
MYSLAGWYWMRHKVRAGSASHLHSTTYQTSFLGPHWRWDSGSVSASWASSESRLWRCRINHPVFSTVRLSNPASTPVLALTLVLGSLRAIKNPVRLALAYDFAGRQQATRALSGISVASRIGMLIGAIAIGVLTDRFGVAVALILMALMHTAAAGALTGIRSRNQRVAADNTPLWQNLSDYVREFRVNRVLLMLVLVTAGIELFGTSYTSALPELATSRLALTS